MMRAAVRLGIMPDVFWTLSVREWRWLTIPVERGGLTREALENLCAEHPDSEDMETKNG
ncbi:MAG: phage tail assembly chaperone [Pseudomonadota bacterium]